MKKTVFFLNMFPDYEPPEALKSVLSQAAIVAADIDPEGSSVEVAIHSEVYIPVAQLEEISRELRLSYGLRKLRITATHPADQLQNVTVDELMGLFVEENSMNRSALAGAKWNWKGNTLTVKLMANGVKELREGVPAVAQNLSQRFDVPVQIEIEGGNALEGKALFEAMDRMRENYLQVSPAAAAAPQKAAAPKQDSTTFYGKPIKTPAVPMRELSLDIGSVTVEGKVFSVEHKELK